MAVLSTLAPAPLSLLALALPALILSEAAAFYPGSAIFKLAASSAFLWRSVLVPPARNSTSSWITASLACGLVGDFCLIPSKKAYSSPKAGHEGDSPWFKVGMLAFMLNHAGYIIAFLQSLPQMNWLTFAVTFVACIAAGDLAGMPVPWRRAAGSTASSTTSPRLPTVSTKVKNTDIPSSPLAADRPTTSDSGVTDLSISIPTTPKPSSPQPSTAASPLLPSSRPSSSSFIPTLAIPPDMKPLILLYQLIITTMVASATGTRGLTSARALGAVMFMVSDMIVAWDTFSVKSSPTSAEGPKQGSCGRDGWVMRGVGWVLYFGGQYLLAARGAA
ncbi:hypothetical protein DRE_04175 [Drechslerella stenobrocha 248]|uniref:YhhN-like protein n=1 Tax=Drechslerella stenobrocha 248 TaxID=1043628 RepID=W7I3C2_9PEZI|nr:hypothetical protein DRE_04175 [Drechslerella stenobrocha 248]